MTEEIENVETTTAPSTPPAPPSLPSYKIINPRTLSVRPSYKPSHRGAPEELIQEFIFTGDHCEETVQQPQPPPGSVRQQPPVIVGESVILEDLPTEQVINGEMPTNIVTVREAGIEMEEDPPKDFKEILQNLPFTTRKLSLLKHQIEELRNKMKKNLPTIEEGEEIQGN